MSVDYAKDSLKLITKEKQSNYTKPINNYARFVFVLPDNAAQNPIDPSFNDRILNEIRNNQTERSSNIPVKEFATQNYAEAGIRSYNAANTLFYCFIIMKADDRKVRNDKKVSYRLRIYDHTLTPIDLKINVKKDNSDFTIESDAVKELQNFLHLTPVINGYSWYSPSKTEDVSIILEKLNNHLKLNKKLIPIVNHNQLNQMGGKRTKKHTNKNKNKKRAKQTRKH